MFNYQTQDLLDLLAKYDYRIYQYLGDGEIVPFDVEQIYRGIINMIAAKDEEIMVTLLNS